MRQFICELILVLPIPSERVCRLVERFLCAVNVDLALPAMSSMNNSVNSRTWDSHDIDMKTSILARTVYLYNDLLLPN